MRVRVRERGEGGTERRDSVKVTPRELWAGFMAQPMHGRTVVSIRCWRVSRDKMEDAAGKRQTPMGDDRAENIPSMSLSR